MRALILSVLALSLITAPADATLLALWDAAFPGASPSTQWDDLSGNGNHLGQAGPSPSTLNGTSDAFQFGGPDPGSYCCQSGTPDGPYRAYFERSAAGSSDFEFETDIGGTGTPFTIGAWHQVLVDQNPPAADDFPSVLIQKGTSRNNEWVVRPRRETSNTELIFNELGNGGADRMFA